jgi:hypothetical protein
METSHPTTGGAGANKVAAQAPLQSIESDREFKAHIYQQLVDLQPFLSPDSQIAVLVQQDDEEEQEDKGIGLTLVATFGDYRLEAEGRDENAYKAFGIAKQKMLDQIDEYCNAAIDSSDRDEEIQNLMSGAGTIH